MCKIGNSKKFPQQFFFFLVFLVFNCVLFNYTCLCVFIFMSDFFLILIPFQYTGTHKTYNVPLKMSTLNQLCSIVIKTETKGHWLDKRLLVL